MTLSQFHGSLYLTLFNNQLKMLKCANPRYNKIYIQLLLIISQHNSILQLLTTAKPRTWVLRMEGEGFFVVLAPVPGNCACAWVGTAAVF